MSYERLIQNYSEGGLKLVDLEIKAKALKAKWPLYFKERQEIWLYGSNLDHRIWQYNTSSGDSLRYCQEKKLGTIFSQIWAAWNDLNYEVPTEIESIIGQRIWGNSNIKQANRPFFDKKWLNSNVEFIYQLRKEGKSNTLLCWEEIREQYREICIVMEYNSLISAIPTVWKSVLKYEDCDPNIESKF